jgi:hypothetical protein
VAAYPGIYRAKAIKLDGTRLAAYIPQVFGDVQVTIENYVGSAPSTSEMGWVSFQGGNPEFPVWHGAGQGNGNGGGGGTVTDTLWVGPTPPFDPSIEMWWDTDEPTSFASTSDVWNTAWGILVHTPSPATTVTVAATSTLVVASTPVPLIAGRRYRVRAGVRAWQTTPVSGNSDLTLVVAGPFAPTSNSHDQYATTGGGYSQAEWVATFDCTANTSGAVYTFTATTTVASTLYGGSNAGVTVEDIGPVTRVSSSFTPPTDDWSPYDARYSQAIPGTWQPLAMSGTWTLTNPYGFATPAWRKAGDMVYLRGTTQNPSGMGTGNSVIATLPVGARPPVPLICPCWMSWNSGSGRDAVRINVTADGGVEIQGSTYGLASNASGGAVTVIDHLSLEPIIFSTTA